MYYSEKYSATEDTVSDFDSMSTYFTWQYLPEDNSENHVKVLKFTVTILPVNIWI
jgi:hypothetical protein